MIKKIISGDNFKKRTPATNPFGIRGGGFGRGKLKDFSYRLQWTEDSFLAGGGKETIGRNFDFFKVRLAGFFILLFFSIIFARTAYLQVVKGDYYREMAEGNRIRFERAEAKRGVIYDRNFNSLVRNVPNFMIYFVPADLPEDGEELDSIIEDLSGILGNVSPDEIKEKLSGVKIGSLESYQPLFAADNIDHEKAMKLYLKSSEWPGVILTSKSRREYNLYSLSLSHILGYTGKISPEELEDYGDEYQSIDYIGKMGVEYFWENELKGASGKKQVEVDAIGKEKKVLSETEAEDGHNLALSLDIAMQKKLEDIVIEYLQKLKLNKASAIVMDPNNGEILAMVSFPSYNNNVFARGITRDEYGELMSAPDNPLFNRAVSGEYPSGSTIKPVMSAAALEEGVIGERTSFMSVGGINVGVWNFPDWKVGGHGVTDVRKAIAESVNTFFYCIGGGCNDFKGLGIDRIAEYFRLFGLGAQTGIDLSGEAAGFVPAPEWKEEVKGESWYIGDTYHISIGQGDLLVTPLQVASYTSFFANGGKIYRPHLVREVLSGDDKQAVFTDTAPVRENFIDEEYVRIVKEGMRKAVTSGSAARLQSVSVEAAGKTGTAQWSTQKDPHAWFTGFAPYDNPRITITIIVEEGGEGSSVAVPMAQEFLEWYFGEYKRA